MTDMFYHRDAEFAFDGAARLIVTRIWDNRLPIAGWLACNPSDMDAEKDDPTGRRFEHFSRAVGCGGYRAANVWPLVTPYPAELWRALREGRVTEAMMQANDDAIERVSRAAERHFVAFGVEPGRRHPATVKRALISFGIDRHPLLCLRASPDGWPMHPLARGKSAIPNNTQPTEWRHPQHGEVNG